MRSLFRTAFPLALLAVASLALAEKEDKAAKPGKTESIPTEERKPALPEGERHAEILSMGVVTFVGEDQIRVKGKAYTADLAKEMTFKLTDETGITVGGKPASKKDLLVGMAVTVTASRHGEVPIAKRIDAKPMPL